MQLTKKRPRATADAAFSVPPHQTYKFNFCLSRTCETKYNRIPNMITRETGVMGLRKVFISPFGHLTNSSFHGTFIANILTSVPCGSSQLIFPKNRYEKVKLAYQTERDVATKQSEKHKEARFSPAKSSSLSPVHRLGSDNRSLHRKQITATASDETNIESDSAVVDNFVGRHRNNVYTEENSANPSQILQHGVKSSTASSPGRRGQKQTTQTRKEFEHLKKRNKSLYSESAPVRMDFESILAFLSGTEKQMSMFIRELRTGKRMLSVSQFNEVVSLLSRRGRISSALGIVETAESGNMAKALANARSAKSYTIMIDVYGKAHQLSKAFALFYNMSRMGASPTVVTYNAMIASCARCSEPNLAYEVFEEMQMNGFKPDKFSYGALIDSCAKCGKVDRAFEISNLMEANGVEKDETIYSALMDACGRTEQLERALGVFEEMKRKGVWPNQVTFAVLIDMCAKVKQPERAFYLYSELKHWGYAPANVIVFTALIDACAKCGWPERAELVVQSMVSQGIEPNQISFGALMEAWAKEGRLDRAFEVLDRMSRKHKVFPNAVLIGGLIASCRRLRETWRVGKLWEIIVTYNLRPSKIYYPSLILMALTENNLRLATAVVLHAFARGYLRRAVLNSEDPAMHAMACAIIYFRNELLKSEYGASIRADTSKAANRLNTVFKSLAMSVHDMDSISASTAREVCFTWGNTNMREVTSSSRSRTTRRDRNASYRKEIASNSRRRTSDPASFATRRTT